MIGKFRLGLCQTKITNNKLRTLKEVEDCLQLAVSKGAQMILLPECFNSIYDINDLKQNAENFEDSVRKTPTLNFLRQFSKKMNVYIAGSIPEESEKQYYNTGLLFNPDGQLQLKQRKIHLCEIQIEGEKEEKLKEQEIFKAGNKIQVVETQFGRVGMAIGQDLRFAQVSQIMAQKKKAQLILFPSNFNHTLNSTHWELLLKSRAIQNQCFVAGCNPSSNSENQAKFQTYGHSIVVDPLGKIISENTTPHNSDDILELSSHRIHPLLDSTDNHQNQQKVEIAQIDFQQINIVRQQLGVFNSIRQDLYETIEINKL